MEKSLVIVESPAKAKTIGKILGSRYEVKSSMGHVRDLPVNALGVDLKDGFRPKYVAVKGRTKQIAELKEAAQPHGTIYLAPDPDREGEAIAWHLREILAAAGKQFHRVQYNEITPRAVRDAFANPGPIDMRRVEAQQARRILDRIVGYLVSPMLWRRVKRGLSAGRVQSVALRLLCERRAEIERFVPEAFWLIGAVLRKQVAPLDPFQARLVQVDGKKAEVGSEELAARIRADLEGRGLQVVAISSREMVKRPPPPFITSTLQQAASSALGITPKRAMAVAQRLYEGVDLGEGPEGLITYMRTDSVAVSRDAQEVCREFIVRTYGAEYCPDSPNVYRSRSSAQEAHEAIRPTDVSRIPERVQSRLTAQEGNLYGLVWRRFVASQMAAARLVVRGVDVEPDPPPSRPTRYRFRATASEVRFPGYMKVSGREESQKNGDEEPREFLPPLTEGERLVCLEWTSERKETQPPPRYTEAALIRALEGNGIGRPSTYAQIISTLYERRYAASDRKAIEPTELGRRVNRLLVDALPALFDVKFTAAMEESLDEVEEGKVEWTRMLDDFYNRFKEWMAGVREPSAKPEVVSRLLSALEAVKEWAPEIRRGKRVYSDERFVESIRKQVAKGARDVTARQLDALARIAGRYRDGAPGIGAALTELGLEEAARPLTVEPPDEATLKKLAALENLRMDDSTTAFVASLRARTADGRSLSSAQTRALDSILGRYSGQIENFEAMRESLGLGPAEVPPEDSESAALLEAVKAVKQWRDPSQRGRRVYDDRAFVESLRGQFMTKGVLTDRQRDALRKLVGRYREQIPRFDRLSESLGLPAVGEESRERRETGNG